jgi:AcrR family transcriptional regulator
VGETLRFQVARSTERRRPGRRETLRLFDEDVAQQLFDREGVDPPEPGEYPGQAVITAATGWCADGSCFADPDRAATPHQPFEPGTPRDFAVVIDMLRQLDDWLAGTGNRPAVDRLLARTATLAEEVPGIDASESERAEQLVSDLLADPRWSEAWDCLRRSFCALLAAEAPDAEAASRAAGKLQRLLLVAGLVEALSDQDLRPSHPEDVRRLLYDRVVVIPNPPFPIVDVEPLVPRRRARLAQRAGFGDLWVVREEWACYQAGEIAHIENVLEGELRRRVHKRVDETETTETTETETTRVDQLDTQTTDRFELTEETTRDTSLAIRVDGQVDTSGQYGPTRVETHIGGGLDWSVQESSRHASEVAHESVERAVRRVEERVRTERVRRTLTRVEETNLHEIDNSSDPTGSVVGVYRWVDKIQRMQLFRYPNRYLLEFQVPEPAALVRWIQGRDTGPEPTTPAPPPFTTDGKPLKSDESNLFTISSFGPDDFGRYAARWRADVDPPPDPAIWISGSAAVALEEPQSSDTSVLTLAAPPSASTTITLAIADGYAAVAARVAAAGPPIHAKWQDHPEGWDVVNRDGWSYRDGYHSIHGEVTVGSETIPLYDSHPNNATVVPVSNAPLPQYAESWLSSASGEVTLDATPEREVAVGVTLAGTYKGTVSVALRCVPTRGALQRWRLDTYAALLDAHRSWQAQYDNERRAIQVRSGIEIEGSSPARNREVIREELKRLVIEMLYGSRFNGVSAVQRSLDTPTVPPGVDPDAALDAVPEIQFLEQVFEWDKMTYVLYPYFWADAGQWADLQPIEGADPEFARFLRAGSARVVVAARPGYANAVNHWLWFGRPWGGGPAPTPGAVGYVSIADEIRALNQAPDEGEPQESWEVRLPTTLIWLDPDPTLPKYNRFLRLDEPDDPRARLCRPARGRQSEDAEPGEGGGA